jgi:predicted AlkP superfamily pyrophosphatase or phosphodiesterase
MANLIKRILKRIVNLRYVILFLFIINLFITEVLLPTSASQVINNLKPTVILISFDGFRWDYFKRASTPNLNRLSKTGIKAKELIPSFPTKTFPNHYTIVTGLFPEHHGIIGNKMYDPALNATFSLGDRKSVEDSRWWGGEPIWVTAEKQGQTSAVLFWPGSETKIKDIRPTYWKKYDMGLTYDKRIKQTLDWLDLPVEKRPNLIALYFDAPDTQGHIYGPDSPEAMKAVYEVDKTLGILMQGLKQRGIINDINIIVTSDHGMTPISPDKIVFLDDYIDLSSVDIIDWSPVLSLRPHDGKKDEIYKALVNVNPHLTVYYKEDISERFHFRNNDRITPIIGIADEGWSISSHNLFQSLQANFGKGNHGYDNQLTSMHGIFIAGGPAFKKGLTIEPFENIQIYNLIAKILQLKPAQNDGKLEKVQSMLKSKQ